MKTYPKIAIVYLSYHSEPYMDDVVGAIKKMTYPKDRVELVIVDNPHPTHGSSVSFLADTVMPLSGADLPTVTLLPQKENLGFTAGNNVGIRWALSHGCDYVYLHNNDGFMASQNLELLVAALENDQTIGAAQSLLMLYPETDLLNSSGNNYHYLGFGYVGNFRKNRNSITLPPIKDCGYASGASLILRASLLEKYGLLDEDFFLYHEDLEYSLRLRSVGYRTVCVTDAIFYHKYAYGRNSVKYYFMERNRLATLILFYKIPTLLLIAPMLFIMEIGQWFFALKSGLAGERVKICGYWLKLSNWRLWIKKRKHIQALRSVNDRELLKTAVGVIEFEEKSINTPLLRYFANPLMEFYWRIVRGLI